MQTEISDTKMRSNCSLKKIFNTVIKRKNDWFAVKKQAASDHYDIR